MFLILAGGSRDAIVTDALLFMIAKDNMPLCTTERVGFSTFVKKLQPLWRIPSEPTVTKKLHLKYETLKERILEKFSLCDSICLTTDIWTHKNTMSSYLGITAHYLEGKLSIFIFNTNFFLISGFFLFRALFMVN